MSTITTIQPGDLPSNSRADINNNFSALNTDKMETSVLDTDTTLAANSDAKIPSQKAVKAYVDAGGNVNASETGKGIVEEATDAEVTAGTATGGTGAKLFVTPAKLATRLSSITRTAKVAASGSTTEIANNTVTETNIFSESISAGLLGTSNALRFKVYVSNLATDSDTSSDPTFRLKYGSTTLATLTLQNSATANTGLKGYIEGTVIANASATAQTGTLSINLTVNDLDISTHGTEKRVQGFASGTATENSAGALNLTLTIQWGGALGSNDFVPAGYIIESIS